MVFVFADESEILLIVLPILTLFADVGDMNQSFAARLVQLHKQSEIGYAGDMSGQHLTYMVRHPHGLKEFDGVPFGLCGFLLASGAMFAFLLQFFAGQGLFLAGQDIFLHEPMHHQVGSAR